MDHVISKDGTRIAYDRSGTGPAVVMVGGASVDRWANAPVGELLADRFTVFNYDRRGRGPSGDTPPYAVAREIEDLDALIGAAGGSAFAYGTSSGAALVLEAAIAGVPITKLALWEPPYIIDPALRPPSDAAETYEKLVSDGRRGDAVEFFMTRVVGMPAAFVEQARSQPWWAPTEALAHTLAYDARIMGDYSVPLDRAAGVEVPTLLLTGGASPPFMLETAEAIAKTLPNAEIQTLEGQTHDVAPTAIAPVLEGFFMS